MGEILESRLEQIKDELESLLGEYTKPDYDYDEDENIYVRDVDKLINYIEWELKHESYSWRERGECERKQMVKLLAEYIVIKKNNI